MRFTSSIANNGFDDRAWPRLQVIPVGETRTIEYSSTRELMPRVSGQQHVQVIPACPTARTRGGTLTVKGLTRGEDKIVWVRSGNFREGVAGFRTLRFLVLEKVTLKVTFNFVTDTAVEDAEPNKTGRQLNEVGEILRKANAILQPQMNLVLTEKTSRSVTVERPLGKQVSLSNKDTNGNIKAMKAKGDPNADLNVFFLWDLVLGKQRQGQDDVGLARAADPTVFIDDLARSTDDAALTLAHETLHVYYASHVASDEHLMAETYAGGGRFIPSDVAKRCHTHIRAQLGMLHS